MYFFLNRLKMFSYHRNGPCGFGWTRSFHNRSLLTHKNTQRTHTTIFFRFGTQTTALTTNAMRVRERERAMRQLRLKSGQLLCVYMCRLDPPSFSPTPLARPHSQTNARGILRHTHTHSLFACVPSPPLCFRFLCWYTILLTLSNAHMGLTPPRSHFCVSTKLEADAAVALNPTSPFFLFFFDMYFLY